MKCFSVLELFVALRQAFLGSRDNSHGKKGPRGIIMWGVYNTCARSFSN